MTPWYLLAGMDSLGRGAIGLDNTTWSDITYRLHVKQNSILELQAWLFPGKPHGLHACFDTQSVSWHVHALPQSFHEISWQIHAEQYHLDQSKLPRFNKSL